MISSNGDMVSVVLDAPGVCAVVPGFDLTTFICPKRAQIHGRPCIRAGQISLQMDFRPLVDQVKHASLLLPFVLNTVISLKFGLVVVRMMTGSGRSF